MAISLTKEHVLFLLVKSVLKSPSNMNSILGDTDSSDSSSNL